MDAGIVDTINREDARKIAARFDQIDEHILDGMLLPVPWYFTSMAKTLTSENSTSNSDRAWLVGQITTNIPGLRFDGEPADGDWENLFSNIRAEILARRARDPQTPPAKAAATQLAEVV